MPPVEPIEFAAINAEHLATELLGPAIFAASTPAQVTAWQSADRVDFDTALGMPHEPVQPGWRWGPVWSTAWFKVQGNMPEGEGTPAVQFSSGTEALLYLQDGRSWHGLDMYRDVARLPEDSAGEITVHVEAACNRPLGATLFWWDPAEDHARWAEDAPGRLGEVCFVRVHEPTWRLKVALDFGARLLRALDAASPQARHVADALARVSTMIDDVDVRGTTPEALGFLEDAFKGHAQSTQVTGIGHAHIDTAWLWPIAETRRKVRRSWATALRLMDRYDDFHFTASQTQQYAWLEEDDPALLAAIGERVKEGRWEANGAMWIEPDCQIPSGESLVRQFVHGTAWWKGRFGEAAPQSVLYLPDTFGFPASLPQLMELAGVRRFVTNKICWNEVTAFPFVDFTWRGIDGTQVPAHFTPGHTYNAAMEPQDLVGAQANAMADGPVRTTAWMQPFGWGDGGGGPTDAMVERARLSADAPGLPRVHMGTLHGFGRPEPAGGCAIWDGELYLEMHRGTFTAQGWLKRANHAAEEALRLAEMLAADDPVQRVQTRQALDAAWKRLLLQQFHDILPGSSIPAVYEDARRDMAAVQMEVMSRIDAVYAPGEQAYNRASTVRSGVLDTAQGPRWAAGVEPLASAPMYDILPDDVGKVRVDGLQLDNGIIACRIGEDGAVHELRREGATGPLPGPVNELRLYRDRPRRWEAWDIDKEYANHPVDLPAPTEVTLVEAHPMRAVVEVKRDIGAASAAVMRYTMRAGSPVLEVELAVDWAEERRLLRCEWGTDIRATQATYGIQFGHVQRATHENTPFDEARFEVPGHRWFDCSEAGRGLAVLDEAIYGRSARHGRMGLSLLRATNFPDPEADRGAHVLRWGLLPHDGCPLRNDVPAVAEAFAGRGLMPSTPREAPFTMRASAHVGLEVAAWKGAEDDRGRVLRLVEKHGGHGHVELAWPAAVRVTPCDLHEQHRELPGLVHEGTTTRVPLRPFGVVTLRIEDGA